MVRVWTGQRLAPSPPIIVLHEAALALREPALVLRESMLAQGGTILHPLKLEGSRGKSTTSWRKSGPRDDNSDAAGTMCGTIHMKCTATSYMVEKAEEMGGDRDGQSDRGCGQVHGDGNEMNAQAL